jgi:hypothetical protein
MRANCRLSRRKSIYLRDLSIRPSMPHLDRPFQKTLRKEPLALAGAYIAGCHFNASECSSELRIGPLALAVFESGLGLRAGAVWPIFLQGMVYGIPETTGFGIPALKRLSSRRCLTVPLSRQLLNASQVTVVKGHIGRSRTTSGADGFSELSAGKSFYFCDSAGRFWTYSGISDRGRISRAGAGLRNGPAPTACD